MMIMQINVQFEIFDYKKKTNMADKQWNNFKILFEIQLFLAFLVKVLFFFKRISFRYCFLMMKMLNSFNWIGILLKFIGFPIIMFIQTPTDNKSGYFLYITINLYYTWHWNHSKLLRLFGTVILFQINFNVILLKPPPVFQHGNDSFLCLFL